MPNSSITKRLASLPKLSKPTACDLWRQLFKREPPSEIRKDLMLRIVAHTACRSRSLVASATLAAADFASLQPHSRPIPTQWFQTGCQSSPEPDWCDSGKNKSTWWRWKRKAMNTEVPATRTSLRSLA